MAGDNIAVKDGNGFLQTLGAYFNGVALILRKVQVPSPAQTDGIAPVSSAVLENSHVFKAGPGNFYGLNVTLQEPGWVFVFNAASVPADGSVTPVEILNCPAAATYSLDNGVIPDFYSVGICACFSTTGPNQTTGQIVKTTPTASGGNVAGQAIFKGRVQ